MHRNERSLPAVRRRLLYLQQEIYNYEKYFKNAEGSDAARLRDLTEDSRSEEEELSFLIEFYEARQAQQREIPSWMFLTVSIIAWLSLILAAIALWN